LPAGHGLHDESVHISVAEQRVPQAPQLFGSHLKLAHESGAPLAPWQTVLPLVQHEPQAPSTQVSPLPQALPHAPQLAASDFRFTQESPQTVPWQGTHFPSLQEAPFAQALPHAPQFAGSDLVSVQDAPQTVPLQQEGRLASAGVQTFSQLVGEIRLPSSVTAPFRASARPVNVTLLFSVMLDRAMMLPCHADPTPSVTELPATK
jgi:hypothetical protein